eukprot:TRINITY_DN37480_c0_g1_i1.p1 TRINITY_DN37480_c0_g1~~TRINITY_DN37480_c0_g1_i1.p1  ORF type:complete len:398 (+),score=45.50 TRINITY_DN37480_c0_g1_i1:92-1285(+)
MITKTLSDDGDSPATLQNSRFFVVRALSYARQHQRRWGSMEPMPLWLVVFVLISWPAGVVMYFMVCLACLRSTDAANDGDRAIMLFVALLVIDVPTHLAVHVFARSYTWQFLRAPDPKTPSIRRGSVVRPKGFADIGTTPSDLPARSALRSLLTNRPARLVDQDVRLMVFFLGSLGKFVCFMLNVIAGILMYTGRVKKDDTSMIVLAFVTSAMVVCCLCEYLITIIGGLGWSLMHNISRRIVERRRMNQVVPFDASDVEDRKNSSRMVVPCDPRAVILQNAFIGCIVAFSSLLLLCGSFVPDLLIDQARWLLPATGFYMTMIVTTYGGACSMCPVASIFGYLIMAGLVPQPKPELDDEYDVVALCYSLWGPIIELKSSSSSSSKVDTRRSVAEVADC